MYFTREPIIETIITPKEGYKLVIRNSKGIGQEEFFLDALEVVSFGNSLFFRSTERPKSFLVPVSDYEVLEIRETRMALKSIAIDRGIKIAGGREASLKPPKEVVEKETESFTELEKTFDSDVKVEASETSKRKERRRFRKRRGRDDRIEQAAEDLMEEEAELHESPFLGDEIKEDLSDWSEDQPEEAIEKRRESAHEGRTPAGVFSNLLPPPTTLISETISRYKDTPIFAGAFYSKEEMKTEQAVETEASDEAELISHESLTNIEPSHQEDYIESELKKDEQETSSNPESNEELPF